MTAKRTFTFEQASDWELSDPNLIEIVDGALRLRESRRTFAASFTESMDAEIAAGDTEHEMGVQAELTSDGLKLVGGPAELDHAYIDFASDGNLPPGNKFTIRFKIIPHYSGVPQSRQFFVCSWGGDPSPTTASSNKFKIFQESAEGIGPDGSIQIRIWVGAGTTAAVCNTAFNTNKAWEPVAGQEYDFEWIVDFDNQTAGRTDLFIDGEHFGTATVNQPAQDWATSETQHFRFGANQTIDDTDHPDSQSNFTISEVEIFSAPMRDLSAPGFPAVAPVLEDAHATAKTAVAVNALNDHTLTFDLEGSSTVTFAGRDEDQLLVGPFDGLSDDLLNSMALDDLAGHSINVRSSAGIADEGLGLSLMGLNGTNDFVSAQVTLDTDGKATVAEGTFSKLLGFILGDTFPSGDLKVSASGSPNDTDLFVRADDDPRTLIGLADAGAVSVGTPSYGVVDGTAITAKLWAIGYDENGAPAVDEVGFADDATASGTTSFSALLYLGLADLDSSLQLSIRPGLPASPYGVGAYSSSPLDTHQELTLFGLDGAGAAQMERLLLSGDDPVGSALQWTAVFGVQVNGPLNGDVSVVTDSGVPLRQLRPEGEAQSGLKLLPWSPEAGTVTVSGSSGGDNAVALFVGKDTSGLTAIEKVDFTGGTPSLSPLATLKSVDAVTTMGLAAESLVALLAKADGASFDSLTDTLVGFKFEVDGLTYGVDAGAWAVDDGTGQITFAPTSTGSPQLSDLVQTHSAVVRPVVQLSPASDGGGEHVVVGLTDVSFDAEAKTDQPAAPSVTQVFGFVTTTGGEPLAGLEVIWSHQGFFLDGQFIPPEILVAVSDQDGMWSVELVSTAAAGLAPYSVGFRRAGDCDVEFAYSDLSMPAAPSISLPEVLVANGELTTVKA